MNLSETTTGSSGLEFAERVNEQARNALETAVYSHRKKQRHLESIKNTGDVIAAEYGDRVLFELIQNAHDAHAPGENGAIAIKLKIVSETEGYLYIANKGCGFADRDFEAIVNIAISGKEIGEGIGNKGLGFRSVETITDDVRIYSRSANSRQKTFDGYCFRFAEHEEIVDLLSKLPDETAPAKAEAEQIAANIPRYLVPRPIQNIPRQANRFANLDYATVIEAPLRGASAVSMVERQVSTLLNLDHPLLLFLDRIGEVRVEIDAKNAKPNVRRLTRRERPMEIREETTGLHFSEVSVGEKRKFLMIRQGVDKKRVLSAVKDSIDQAPPLKRWLDWSGQPSVAIAVGLSTAAIVEGQFYNFLPMGAGADAPIQGHINAPFFADIDRRDLDLDLPLNNELLSATAETCAAAAQFLVENNVDVPQRSIFDLIAWTGEWGGKLDDVFEEQVSSLKQLRAIPILQSVQNEKWSSLDLVTIWPDAKFALMKPREVSKHVDIHIASQDLDAPRLDRLVEMAGRCFGRGGWQHSRLPHPSEIDEWSAAYAKTLLERKVKPATWVKFYRDLVTLCRESEAELSCLAGAAIFVDRSQKLRPAGGSDDEDRNQLYVRKSAEIGKRKKGNVPFPPSTLTRRYRFFDDKIELPDDILTAFVDAGLLKRFDPIEVLASISTALGEKPTAKRQTDAISWAFRVWEASGKDAEEAISEAGLHVATRGGWALAKEAIFSETWTDAGRKVEQFLTDAAQFSRDCYMEKQNLLKPVGDWLPAGASLKKATEFCKLLGVVDGLRPIPAPVVKQNQGYIWNNIIENGDEESGLDPNWSGEEQSCYIYHPYTNYTLRGELFRLPGQNQFNDLPEHLRERFYELVVHHLEHHGNKFLATRLGRFERPGHAWDQQTILTPIGVFLRTEAWILAEQRGDRVFAMPSTCWASRSKRPGVPKFIPKLSEDARALLDSDELSELLFGDISVMDWMDIENVVEKLRVLAEAASQLLSGEQKAFRDNYSAAWSDLLEIDGELPESFPIALFINDKIHTVRGDDGKPLHVFLVKDAQSFEARAVANTGLALLEAGDVNLATVQAKLAPVFAHETSVLDDGAVKLRVDGSEFTPSPNDDLLIAAGLDWLPDVAILANEVAGEQLAIRIPSDHINRKVRSIRLRWCQSIDFAIGGQQLESVSAVKCYGISNPENPTLIIKQDIELNWRNLALHLAPEISKLIDSRLRALQPTLLRLGYNRSTGSLEPPSASELAEALHCDVSVIEDLRSGMRTDLAHILHLVFPLVAYFEGVEIATVFDQQARNAGSEFDLRERLEAVLGSASPAASDILAVCETSVDRREAVSRLNLEFGRINRILIELDEPVLGNETELRAVFNAHLDELSPVLRDRLRQLHYSDFKKGESLAVYVSRKSLEFIPFDPDWVLDCEILEGHVVRAHIERMFASVIGEIPKAKLAAYASTIKSNRKSARLFAIDAKAVLETWCLKAGVAVPRIWETDDPQDIVRAIENAGWLDFEAIEPAQWPALCQCASIWPEDMPPAIEPETLGLDAASIEAERDRKTREQQERARKKRIIPFAGKELDPEDAGFASQIDEIAGALIEEDESWLKRSRQRTSLVDLGDKTRAGSAGGGGNRKKGIRQQGRLTESTKTAMGVASEWLAFQYLQKRFPGMVSEESWVSQNRAKFFGGSEGDDSAGYDFLVRTPTAEWMFEVKSTLEDGCEFELTSNEIQVASSVTHAGVRRYRILYVPYVFSPEKWCVFELPNPMDSRTQAMFSIVGRGSVRMRFERG